MLSPMTALRAGPAPLTLLSFDGRSSLPEGTASAEAVR